MLKNKILNCKTNHKTETNNFPAQYSRLSNLADYAKLPNVTTITGKGTSNHHGSAFTLTCGKTSSAF